MLFIFLVSMLVFAIAIRAGDYLIRQNFFNRSELTKIGTGYFGLVLVMIYVLPHSYRSFWCAICIPLLLAAAAGFLLVRRRAGKFRDVFCAMLSGTALKMKTGRSFRHALGEACNESDRRFRGQLTEIINAVVFSQQIRGFEPRTFVNDAINELTRIDQNPHASLKRLAVFRQKLRIENNFRRRSGQVLARTRAQSMIMSILFFVLLAFMIWNFGWTANAPTFLLAILLFSIGGAWILISGRNIQWKV